MKKILITSVLSFLAFSMHPQNGSWSTLDAEGEVLPRHENALSSVGNKIILLGGRGNKPLNILDLETGKWSQGAQPPYEIHHFQAVTLDGLLYVLGGFTGVWPYETPLSHVLIYDLTEDLWVTGPEIPENRRRGAAGAAVYQDKIYLVNGIINGHTSGWVNWMDEYDPYTGNWKILPASPVARDHFQAVVIDNKLYVAGGRRSGSVENNGFAGTVEKTNAFDFKTNEWKGFPAIPTPRAGSTTTFFHGNPVVLGGESDRQEAAHDEVEMLDLKTGTWKELPAMKNSRHGTQAVSRNGHILIGAGSGNRGGGPELNSFEIFSSEENPALESEPLQDGELLVSARSLNFSKKNVQAFNIRNSSKNKAIIISYLQLNKPEKFEINTILETPIIIPPKGQIDLQVSRRENTEKSSATIFIKSAGKSAPLEIQLNP